MCLGIGHKLQQSSLSASDGRWEDAAILRECVGQTVGDRSVKLSCVAQLAGVPLLAAVCHASEAVKTRPGHRNGLLVRIGIGGEQVIALGAPRGARV